MGNLRNNVFNDRSFLTLILTAYSVFATIISVAYFVSCSTKISKLSIFDILTSTKLAADNVLNVLLFIGRGSNFLSRGDSENTRCSTSLEVNKILLMPYRTLLLVGV